MSVFLLNEEKRLYFVSLVDQWINESPQLSIMKIRYAVESNIGNQEKSIEEKVNVMRK